MAGTGQGVFDEMRQIFIVPPAWLSDETTTRMLFEATVPVYVSEAEDLQPPWPATALRKWVAAREEAKLAIFHVQHR